MDDWDPTDRVVVIVHSVGPELDPEFDDGPTIRVAKDDPTERQRCEFEEDTVEEYNWAHLPN